MAATAESVPASANCKLPLALCDLVSKTSASDSDIISLSRKFHCPTGIDGSTRVFIEMVLEDVVPADALKAVVLNNAGLSILSGSDDSGRSLHVDVAGRLTAFNVLELQFPVTASHTSGRLLSVTLMIEE